MIYIMVNLLEVKMTPLENSTKNCIKLLLYVKSDGKSNLSIWNQFQSKNIWIQIKIKVWINGLNLKIWWYMPFLAGKSDFCQKKSGNIYVTYLQRELEVFFTIGYHSGLDRHPVHLLNSNLQLPLLHHLSLPDVSSKGPPPCQTHFPAGLKRLVSLSKYETIIVKL